MNKLMTASRVRNVSKHAAIAAIGFATLSLLAMNASAASGYGDVQQTVDFKDLDLSKQADAKRLYRRLRLAASEVCIGYPAESRGSLRNSARARCELTAVTNAVETIGHPSLTALHAAKTDVKLAQSKAKATSNT